MANKNRSEEGCGCGIIIVFVIVSIVIHGSLGFEQFLYGILKIAALGVLIYFVIYCFSWNRKSYMQQQQREHEQRAILQNRDDKERFKQQLLQQFESLLQRQPSINQKKTEFCTNLQQWFMIQPCTRCYESKMRLLAISPSARSVQYECMHCGKTMHGPAATPDAARIIEIQNDFNKLACEYSTYLAQLLRDTAEYDSQYEQPTGPVPKEVHIIDTVIFDAPASPLPFEQTTRSPISEAIRSEVWRRDGGRCVQCESNQNLQFDHIIPVSRGGATTVANMQLLCQPCNSAKSNKI